MNRMIRPLAAQRQQLQADMSATGGLLDQAQELVTAQVEGAGGGHQQTPGLQHVQAEAVEALIGLEALALVLAALDEGRGIEHHQIEALTFLLELAQGVEGVALEAADPLQQAVALGIGAHRREGRGRTVDAHHLFGPEPGGPQSPGADVATDIQGAARAAKAGQAGAILRLIEKPAGLLAGQGRYPKQIALLRHLDLPRVGAPNHLVGQGQSLQFPDGAIVAQQDGRRAQQLIQGGEEVGAGPFHASGGDLHRQQVAVAVYHQAGQTVALPVD